MFFSVKKMHLLNVNDANVNNATTNESLIKTFFEKKGKSSGSKASKGKIAASVSLKLSINRNASCHTTECRCLQKKLLNCLNKLKTELWQENFYDRFVVVVFPPKPFCVICWNGLLIYRLCNKVKWMFKITWISCDVFLF